jgi:hypothetical protein
MSVACAVTASDSVATAASTRFTLKNFMNRLLLIYGILPGAALRPAASPRRSESISHRTGALHDRNVTV